MPEPDRKFCNICGILKTPEDFYIRRRAGCKDRPMSKCKECSKKASMEWARNNREKANEGVRRWRKKYPEREHESHKRWESENRDRVRFLARKTAAKRRNTPRGKLKDNVSCLVYSSIKNGSKAGRCWETLVGYTVDQLRSHLEKRFNPGMTWENYGTYWSIDHKIPVSVFNFERPDDIDFRICWSLKNLQPLECRENSRKKDKIDKPFQPSLAIGGLL